MKRKLAAISTFLFTFLYSAIAFAQDHGEHAAEAASSGRGLVALSAGLAIGIAAAGGAAGQGRAAAAALEGISRNPGAAGKVQTPMILALAFMESLVIFAFIVAFVALAGKV